jgi:hypothetical protein
MITRHQRSAHSASTFTQATQAIIEDRAASSCAAPQARFKSQGTPMSIPVVIKDILREIDRAAQTESYLYINCRTGEMLAVSDEEFRWLDSDDELAQIEYWERELRTPARQVRESSDWVRLPYGPDRLEDEIAEAFCKTIVSDRDRDELLAARDDAREFKSTAMRLGLLDRWNQCWEAEFARSVVNCLIRHGIAYVESMDPI